MEELQTIAIQVIYTRILVTSISHWLFQAMGAQTPFAWTITLISNRPLLSSLILPDAIPGSRENLLINRLEQRVGFGILAMEILQRNKVQFILMLRLETIRCNSPSEMILVKIIHRN